jgi:hypothetical protein
MRAAANEMQTTILGPGAEWGGYEASFRSFPAGFDPGPLLKGLQNDACPVPHWCYMIRGNLKVRYTDGSTDTVRPGDAFYMQPGHVPVVEEDVEFFEVSPADEMRALVAHLERNAAALAATP